MSEPDVLAQLAVIEASDTFQAFRRETPEAYLAHAFVMKRPGESVACQFGYCLPNGKLQVFQEQEGSVERLPEDDAFSTSTIEPIERAAVKIGCAEAERRALAFQQQERPSEKVTKVIIVLQKLKRTLYNCTLVTDQFNIVNIRLDAGDGRVLHHETRSILSLRSKT